MDNNAGTDTPLDLEMLFTATVDGKISIDNKDNNNQKDEEL